jgi:hypothetical protein
MTGKFELGGYNGGEAASGEDDKLVRMSFIAAPWT